MHVRPPLISALGAGLFLWPFLGLGLPAETPAVALGLGVVLAVLLVGIGTHEIDNRRLALLATIAALDAGLRLALVTGIGGFSPMFFLVLCAGFVFGPSFGFLAGSLSLLVSALVTGGVGPWLPYELFGVGWTGLIAGIAGLAFAGTAIRTRILGLAATGFLLGYAYGVILDVWDWTFFFRGAPDIGWSPDLPAATAVARFARYYATTSLAWDTFRAIGNALLVIALGPPVLLAMQRFRSRFTLQIEPAGAAEQTPA